jgi:hypothetical protein
MEHSAKIIDFESQVYFLKAEISKEVKIFSKIGVVYMENGNKDYFCETNRFLN